MSSPGFSATIDLQLRPSLRAVQAVFALHIAAIALGFLAAPPKWLAPALGLLLLISWRRLRRPAVAGYGPAALTRLTWHAEGADWRVETAGGQAEDAELLGSSLVWPSMLVLNFRLRSGAQRSRLLLGDELEPESLRRLRARLLAGAQVEG